MGVLLYEMLTGRRPFVSESTMKLIYAIRYERPLAVRDLRGDVPPQLAAVVERCLEHHPADRYANADEVFAAIGGLDSLIGARRVATRGRALKLTGAVALATLLVGGALFGVSQWVDRADGRIRSLAVLPVNDNTTDAKRQIIARDITTLLIDRLSQVPELRRVTPRTLVAPYRGTQKSSRDIGRELGVDGLVTVTLFRDAERARFTVNLILAEAEQVVWSRAFERGIVDIAALEREVVAAVADEARRRAQR
jgi:TolB-like protein